MDAEKPKSDKDILERALKRERQARAKAEILLENKSRELYLSNQSLTDSNAELSGTLRKLQKKQAQLIQSSKLAAMGQLAAGMAHEINNPLSFIGSNFNALHQYANELLTIAEKIKALTDGFQNAITIKQLINLIANTDLDFISSDLSALAEETNDGLQRIQNIVSSLLCSTHTDDDALLQEGNLMDCLQEVCRSVNEILVRDHPHITFKININSKVDCKFNSDKLKQALMNVLNNAIQAQIKPGIVQIRIKQEDDWIVIIISDQGEGMSTAIADKALNPFFTTRPVGQGLGLGLYIAHTVIEEHKGHIEITSQQDIGTTVKVFLPNHTA